jgi:L-seryl-tRNA(Ser) seleniumtransferase
MRALRVDKMTYAALEATLRIYERGAAEEEIPVISRIASDLGDIASRAESFALSVRRATSGRVKATAEEGASVIGGGSAPEAKLPTVLVALEDEERTAAALEERLRNNSIPIIARTERDRVLIDLRTVREDEEAIIIEALRRLAQPAQGSAASM